MRRAVAFLVIAAALSVATAALADGDPASDVLYGQDVFLPYPPPSDGPASALRQQVAAVYARGERIKVAVIATPADLGAVPSLFGQPVQYAKFLGTELKYGFVGPLLVVMPAGFGVYDGGRSTQPEEAVLAREAIGGAGADDLASSAATAVADLLKANALRSTDVLPPRVVVFKAYGFVGTTVKLQFRLSDDSGKASVVVELRRSTGVLKTIRLALRPAGGFGVSLAVRWRIPPSLVPGPVRYCVTATDPSGNRGRDCKQVLVSKA